MTHSVVIIQVIPHPGNKIPVRCIIRRNLSISKRDIIVSESDDAIGIHPELALFFTIEWEVEFTDRERSDDIIIAQASDFGASHGNILPVV